MQATTHRLPNWHPATNRWRLRIGYRLNAQGKRVEQTFWWAGHRGDGNPPPAIIHAAVSKQDQWREIKANWAKNRDRLRAVRPNLDWSMPVWFDATLLEQYVSVEKSLLDEAVQRAFDEHEREAASDADTAARWFVRNGIAKLMERLQQPLSDVATACTRRSVRSPFPPGFSPVRITTCP
jgi:hypothetical protein